MEVGRLSGDETARRKMANGDVKVGAVMTTVAVVEKMMRVDSRGMFVGELERVEESEGADVGRRACRQWMWKADWRFVIGQERLPAVKNCREEAGTSGSPSWVIR